MRDRDNYGRPEQRASTGLPLSIMLLSMLTIAVYLIVADAFLQNESRDVAVYIPTASGQNNASE
ncbi:hypothetical protein [Sinorhizobium meliloti]|uniref:hypothetical protein n=1 Tax=Rhizobium meliloti TaxID=382 RepID=UPI000B497385|nr:hypothetical protein [Sinorhizobium meliloti]ASP90817.1 hypothetical protein CDO25_06160 [Sinorhizobium meliloti]MQX60078.1 hypothetical protein [Sinorhizobium meliloti]